MHPEYPYNRMKTLLKQAELPLIRFHDLRHTFATHALTGGVDAKTLSRILGHTNASFTLDTYTHVTTEHTLQAGYAVRRLDGVLVRELLQASHPTADTAKLREPHLRSHHSRDRQDTAEQTDAKRSATVLCPAEAERTKAVH